ncbi:4Fe-4S dicluster domain-containing protein [Vreelandella andesensis]|uniref:4Fe-4S dicluster domain-containing protein n=1 Tax=Vreelandella andesensis TaxID=447567 RepID=A0A433KW59_9GAMM|nr:4Fe-4S binding protein [Halomonas andesensis]RUR33929.1 4Fe-4S dicluster domain-containing protein [Halomonas andesensis]
MKHSEMSLFKQFTRIGPGVAVLGWLPSRCLKTPPHPLECDKCTNACPVSAIVFQDIENSGELTLTISDNCHGCSQCVPACPTEAIFSAETTALISKQKAHQTLDLTCHRAVNQDNSGHHIHCLRSLGEDVLAELGANALPEIVTLYIPDNCRGCDAAPIEPNDDWLENANAICHLTNVAAQSPYQPPRSAISRRDLLLGRPTASLPNIPFDDAAPKARRLQRQANAAQTLGPHASPSYLNVLLDTDACVAHGVCSKVCPTQALTEDDGALVFNPPECISCGHCVSACPEKALTASSSVNGNIVTLRQSEHPTCRSCGHLFQQRNTSNNENTMLTCPACQREAMLMQESFHDLFH